jgi:hypothetical protein
MNRTTPKLIRTIAGITGATILMLGCVVTAEAMENGYKAPSCKLYKGTSSLESLKKRENLLKDELLRSSSETTGDHCEMANIHYKLARMLPDQQIQYMNSCIDHSQRAIKRDPSAGVGYF